MHNCFFVIVDVRFLYAVNSNYTYNLLQVYEYNIVSYYIRISHTNYERKNFLGHR